MSSKVVPVSCQNDAARNLNDIDLKSHAKIIAIVHILIVINTKKFSPIERNCVLECEDKVQSWRKLELPPSPTDDSEPRIPCPDDSYSPTHGLRSRKAYRNFSSSPTDDTELTKPCPDDSYSPTQDFLSRKVYRDFLTSPTQAYLFSKACPGSPPSPTHDSPPRKAASPDFPSFPSRDPLLRKAYRESPGRLSRVIEESESFAKREAILIAPPIADPFHYNSPDTPSTSSGEFTNGKPLSEVEKQSPVLEGIAKKAITCMDLSALFLYPLKKIRDGYVNCMMSIEGAGDFTFMVQGGHSGSTGRYFAESPLSHTDSINYG